MRVQWYIVYIKLNLHWKFRRYLSKWCFVVEHQPFQMMYCIPEWQFRMEVRSRVTDVILLFRNHTADIVFCSHRWWYRPIPHSSHFPIPQRAPPSNTPAHTPHHTHFSMYPLHCAVAYNSVYNTVLLLRLRRGADVQLCDNEGKITLSNSVGRRKQFLNGGAPVGERKYGAW